MHSQKKKDGELSNKNERILARRKMLAEKQRKKAEERASQQYMQRIEDQDEEVKLSKSEQQVEDSRQRLRKLYRDGTELVTNITVAVEGQVAAKRTKEEEADLERKNKLDHEAMLITKKFDEIVSKWETIKKIKVPQHLHQLVQDQKAACDQVIQERNRVICELQLELKRKEGNYSQSLKTQRENMSVISERIDNLIRDLNKACKEEIKHIEIVFDEERSSFLNETKDSWETSLQEIRTNEVEYLKDLEVARDEHEQLLHRTQVLDTEEYVTLRSRLEEDVHSLELYLQQMKAIYLLNQEKLEYNFQVLRRREEENLQMKAELKRRLTYLYDRAMNLRNELELVEKKGKEKNIQLTGDYSRIASQIPDINNKVAKRHAAGVDKYNEVYQSKEDEAKVLAQKVLDVDKMIFEQLLNLSWTPPDLSFLSPEGGEDSFDDDDDIKKPSAMDVARQAFASSSEELSSSPSASVSSSLSVEDMTGVALEVQVMKPSELRKLLEFISDEMGFLVEEKLLQLLNPLETNEKTLLTLNSIFTVLGIEKSDDIAELTAYLLKYSHEGEASGEIMLTTNDVLTAFKDYLEAHSASEPSPSDYPTSLKDDLRNEADYWKKFTDILPQSRESLWDGLLYGLEKYLRLLKKRADISSQKNSMSRQNNEMGMLLKDYFKAMSNR